MPSPEDTPPDKPPNLGETPFLGDLGLALMFLFSLWIYVGEGQGVVGVRRYPFLPAWSSGVWRAAVAAQEGKA